MKTIIDFFLCLFEGLFIYVRCKVTGYKYCIGDRKLTGYHPEGYYRTKYGLRYYTNGKITKDVPFLETIPPTIKELRDFIERK